MQQVNSFDIFDTLLARTTIHPTDIFDIIENTYPYPNFKHYRLNAQSMSSGYIDSIYECFKQITNETDENIKKIRDFELQTEMKHTIPIQCNILKMKKGDIFVSDMYLSHDEIKQLMQYHNIHPENKLFVSSGGKSNGNMWKYLNTQYKIMNHCGDNHHSDIIMASHHGINGIYTEIHNFTPIERLFQCNGANNLAIAFRRFRLSMNPFDNEKNIEYNTFDIQAQYNIPLLLHICKKLANILCNENRTTVLFLTRDSCLIIKLFSFFYPQYKSVYFHSSRVMNKNFNNDYVEYVKQHYDKDTCIIFDLQGSFKSARKMFINIFGHLPRVYVMFYNCEDWYYDGITCFMKEGFPLIELLNLDVQGSLVDFRREHELVGCQNQPSTHCSIKNKPIRLPFDANLHLIKIMHNSVDKFIEFVKNTEHFVNDCQPLTECSVFDNDDIWMKFYNEHIKKINTEFVVQVECNHEPMTLTNLANKYNSDKGNSYACAHHYTVKYQEIISDLLKEKQSTENIDLLEIGLNRDNVDAIPSIMMWNEYFRKNCNIIGFDINPAFGKFDLIQPNIRIQIGDQSVKNDLLPLKCKQYDIIIDDGYHASKHQQITFKTLWSCVKSGGYYVIEDLHYQPQHEYTLKTKELFLLWKHGEYIASEFISLDEIEHIKHEIYSIEFYDSMSQKWDKSLLKNAFVYLRKK